MEEDLIRPLPEPGGVHTAFSPVQRLPPVQLAGPVRERHRLRRAHGVLLGVQRLPRHAGPHARLQVDSDGKPGDGRLHGGGLPWTWTSSRVRLLLWNREAPLDASDKPIVHVCVFKTNNERLQDGAQTSFYECLYTITQSDRKPKSKAVPKPNPRPLHRSLSNQTFK